MLFLSHFFHLLALHSLVKDRLVSAKSGNVGRDDLQSLIREVAMQHLHFYCAGGREGLLLDDNGLAAFPVGLQF